MSESSVKQTRRDIRRAFGSVALGTIAEHETQVGLLARSVSDIGNRLQVLQGELDTWTQETAQRQAEAGEALERHSILLKWCGDEVDALHQVVNRTFYGRLCWLLRGR